MEYLLAEHATFMDERVARQRDLIRRLADAASKIDLRHMLGDSQSYRDDKTELLKLIAEARGIEASNE